MKIKHILGVMAIALSTTMCTEDKKDPVIPNEEELITTVNFTLVDSAQTDTVVLRFQDLDGDGGNTPVIIGGTLMPNTTYFGSMELLNEQENPAEDITEEVEEEAEEHQFFYVVNGTNAEITYSDADQNGNPVGLKTVVKTGASSMGTITVILRHEPNKTASGVADGDPTNAGGETDIEVEFDVDIN